MGQSGRCGSAITKFCWMRSTVVARSMATRGKAFGAVIFFPSCTARADASAPCAPHASWRLPKGTCLDDAALFLAGC